VFFDKKSFIKTNRCAEAFSSKRNQLLVLHFVGAFTSDHIAKATKDDNVHFFIHSSNSYALYQRVPENSGRHYLLKVF
jgi:hypothetical protein